MKKFIVNTGDKKYKVNAKTYDEAIAAVKIITMKDDATQLDIVRALVTDEQAAIAAYTNAIANLDGKVDEQYIDVLQNILKEENKHVENLQAIVTGNVTEKNLEDSVKDYGNEDALIDMLERAVTAARAKDWQKVGNICYNAMQVAKQLGAK